MQVSNPVTFALQRTYIKPSAGDICANQSSLLCITELKKGVRSFLLFHVAFIVQRTRSRSSSTPHVTHHGDQEREDFAC